MVILLYLYGSTAEYFDNIYIMALGASCFFCWGDKDTLGALLALIGFLSLSKLLFIAPDSPLYWLLIYGGCLVLSICYFHHITAKILLGFVVFTVGAEIYWWNISYASKPMMAYQVSLIALTVWLRQLLFSRVFIMSKYFGYSSGKLTLDVHIGGIFYSYYVLVILMAVEYFVRHIAGIKDVYIIYNLYTPASTFVSSLTLAVVYMHYFYNQSQKHLPA